MEKFTICVTYCAKDEQAREKFVSELKSSGILELIRNEDGCLKYEYFYSDDDKNKLVLFEEWQNQECQRLHMTQPHMKDAMKIKEKYIESAQLKQIKFI